jgi:hypothetical protein
MKKAFAVGTLIAALGAASACGSGSPASPTVATVAGGTASPVPAPSPSPVAVATPTPEPTESPEINDNDRPVERVGAGVYYIECEGQILENSRSAKEARLGCSVHLDATAKDEDGVPTNPRYPTKWHFSDENALDVRGGNPMGPIITGLRPSDQQIYVTVDGVDSNKFRVKFE